ncbi:SDR family NAD(P)-dependent oxidoreductase [Paenibacillus senegalensis]|uniref:SDR family NAD(P)-dependent oxidoreductase n=1 Tax=Paenibacillus senegalensis TaxID=1465766 RepID=UPI00028926E2|nr:SDR family oxidoreductase [Paenibacillus senegalensis]
MSTNQLDNKVILITGSLGALGLAAVELFLERGANVVACDIRSADESGHIGQLNKRFGADRHIYVQADMTKEDEIERLSTQIETTFGKLDGVFHNAFTNKTRKIVNQPLSEWEDTLRGTLTSAFLVTKHAARQMNANGSIVLTSSILSRVPIIENSAYSAAKAGLEQFARVAAVELAGQGIRVNAIAPGDFKAEHVLAQASEEQENRMRKLTLAGRSGYPNEINEVAAFLLSDAASYVTGALYPVTGGFELCR